MPSPFIPQKHTLQQAWAQYIARLPEIIGEPYEYWGSLTYADHEAISRNHGADILRRRFMYYVGEVNKVVYGKRWMRNGEGVWGALATEKIVDYPHHHFIMGGHGLRASIKRLEMMDMWTGIYGGWARIADYKGPAAAKYITKYVNKGGIVDVWASAKVRGKLKP